jgi:hypothetical protein
MGEIIPAYPSELRGPTGERLTRECLPPASTSHWTARRKALVVTAVNGGLITLDEACRRYALTGEEFQSWRQAYAKHGLRGLQISAWRSRSRDDHGAPGEPVPLAGGRLTQH